ncbi:hypothetical protein JCM39068_35210 [Desulfocastanea catecholica]
MALLGVGVAFLIFIGGGIYLQKHKREKVPLSAAAERVELKTGPEQTQQSQSSTKPPATNTTYFLRPSPEELFEHLAAMENLNADVIDKKISQMPVLWPAYFFALRQRENGQMSVVLDVSKDGFGVVLESAVDPGLYPQLLELARGEKIWIGGKILAVDPAGTGTVYLETDQLRIGAEPPFLPTHQQ